MEIRMEIYGWHFTDNLPILSLPLTHFFHSEF